MNREFSINSPFIFIAGAVLILFVLLQSVVFLVRSWREAKRIGMSPAVLKKVAVSSAVFTVVPALAIVLGMTTMIPALGRYIPWIRLSVIGNTGYELTAANIAAESMGVEFARESMTPEVFTGIVWIMSVGIIWGMVAVLFGLKPLMRGIDSVQAKDKRWSYILFTSLFMGLVAAFFNETLFKDGWLRDGSMLSYGWIPFATLVISFAICFALIQLSKLKGLAWIESFALPLSMILAMGCSVAFSGMVGV